MIISVVQNNSKSGYHHHISFLIICEIKILYNESKKIKYDHNVKQVVQTVLVY